MRTSAPAGTAPGRQDREVVGRATRRASGSPRSGCSGQGCTRGFGGGGAAPPDLQMGPRVLRPGPPLPAADAVEVLPGTQPAPEPPDPPPGHGEAADSAPEGA